MRKLFESLKEEGSILIVYSSALPSMYLGAMGKLISLATSNDQEKLHQWEASLKAAK